MPPPEVENARNEAEAPIPEGIKPRAPDAARAPAPAPTRLPWRRAPILPTAGAEGAPLTAVIAVISALAALALAAFVAISVAADNWTTDLSTSMTVQIKGADASEISARAEAAKTVLDSAPGVVAAELRTPKEAAALLEPWLGEGAEGYLNIPALIEVTVDKDDPPDLATLASDLNAAAEGVSLDDHRTWNATLAATAGAGQALVFGIFLVITGAACAIAVFAARAGLAANAEIIALLHLIGATDQFIASEVQRRFFLIGLTGSIIGVVVALAAAVAAALIAGAGSAGGYLAPSYEISPLLAIPVLVVPIAICLATAFTARLTVLNALRKEL